MILSNQSSAEDVVILTMALLAAVIALWWLGSVVMWLVVLRRPNTVAASFVRRVALPGTRRLAKTLMAAALAALPACSPGEAKAEPPILVWVDEIPSTTQTLDTPTNQSATSQSSTPQPTTRPQATQTPTTSDHVFIEPIAAEPSAPEPATDTPATDQPPIDPSPSMTSTHVVETGEHLWSIASTHLTARLGRPASMTEIATFWRELIELNRHTIFSGDPDLIHPGEILHLG